MNKPTYDQLIAAIKLSAHDELFFSFYNNETQKHDLEIPHPIIMCSDTFAFAFADGENVEWEDVPKLLEIYEGRGWPAITEWVAKKRGMEPIQPVKERMERYNHEH